MIHTLSAVKVYYTKDYDRFRFVKGNRDVDHARVRKIINDIHSGLDILRYCPLLTVENGEFLEVDDGQHRLEVCKKLGSYVWYVLAEDLTIEDIARINSVTERWKTSDF